MNLTWVALDGTDAAGKSTLLERLASRLRTELTEYQVVCVPEFSDTAIGTLINDVINRRYFFQLGADGHLPVPETLVLASDMALQIQQLVERHDGRPTLLLSDRGPLSLIVYQALRIAKHEPGTCIAEAAEWVAKTVSLLRSPDLTVVLRVQQDELLSRLAQRGVALTADDVDFVLQAQDMFVQRADLIGPEYAHIVDNSTGHDAINEILKRIVAKIGLLPAVA
jgi:thymidylate kinase